MIRFDIIWWSRSFVTKNTCFYLFDTHRFRIMTIYDPSDRIENHIEKRQLINNEEVQRSPPIVDSKGIKNVVC